MKYLLCVTILSVALPVVLFAETGTTMKYPVAAYGDSQNDNRGRRRGRGRDDWGRFRRDDNSNRSNSNSSNADGSSSGIASSKARAAALQAVPGTIVKEELGRRDGRLTFEFYVRNPDGETFEVYVDAENLDIVKIERRSRR